MVTGQEPTLLQAQAELLAATLADEKAAEALRAACQPGPRYSEAKEHNARTRRFATIRIREDAAHAYMEARRNRDADLAAAWDAGVAAALKWARDGMTDTALDEHPEMRTTTALTGNPYRDR